MKDKKDKIIISLGIALGVVTIASAIIIIYLLSSNPTQRFSGNSNFMGDNFSLNNETLSQTENVFANATTQDEINSYCSQGSNMIYCREYCLRVNPSDNLCSAIPSVQYPGAPQQ